MKKTYQAPETTILEVMTSQLICLSGHLGDQEITNSNDFGSRGGSAWDDDEY